MKLANSQTGGILAGDRTKELPEETQDIESRGIVRYKVPLSALSRWDTHL